MSPEAHSQLVALCGEVGGVALLKKSITGDRL